MPAVSASVFIMSVFMPAVLVAVSFVGMFAGLIPDIAAALMLSVHAHGIMRALNAAFDGRNRADGHLRNSGAVQLLDDALGMGMQFQ